MRPVLVEPLLDLPRDIVGADTDDSPIDDPDISPVLSLVQDLLELARPPSKGRGLAHAGNPDLAVNGQAALAPTCLIEGHRGRLEHHFQDEKGACKGEQDSGEAE